MSDNGKGGNNGSIIKIIGVIVGILIGLFGLHFKVMSDVESRIEVAKISLEYRIDSQSHNYYPMTTGVKLETMQENIAATLEEIKRELKEINARLNEGLRQ